MSGKRMVSIKTISEKTGLSTATVSRVINNSGGFTQETFDRVQKAVQELGYVPNAMARSLRTRLGARLGSRLGTWLDNRLRRRSGCGCSRTDVRSSYHPCR